ncbi:MAG: fatty-acid--CoA ligase [Ilumatobacteraceae bacterium]|nr:fatty-acid--CoA ligase [Ilumatobacteraceae bacterium]
MSKNGGWNVAAIWERNADRFPDALAQIQGDRQTSWREFDRRADGIAAVLLAGGLAHQDKVAQYLYNCPEYLESMFGLFKAGLVPVNTNYRYTNDEIEYLWTNADAAAVIFHGTFTERCAVLRDRLPLVRLWIWVDDGAGACPTWAVPYEVAASSMSVRVEASWGRSGDDLYMLYTGGTTGMPKGVMWRQDDLVGALDASSRIPLPAAPGWDVFDERVEKPGPNNLPAAPLMHGTGGLNALWCLCNAGCVITMTSRSFDPNEMLTTIERHSVKGTSIVGDAMAKPLLRALDEDPDRWNISSLRVVASSGVMWSAETKAGLLCHNDRLFLMDSLGSSEALGMASSTTSSGSSVETAVFALGPNAKVLTDDGREVLPGSGERGRVALRGRTPIGYYKDEAKSAATFVIFDGVRWSIPGDFAEVDADGRVRLLGRGSHCINTGGEKVFPEEVEEVLKTHPTVVDAAVVGVPDERFGEAVTAFVEASAGATIRSADLREHVRATLAAYKVPKQIVVIESLGRAANGKLDYQALRRSLAEAAIA